MVLEIDETFDEVHGGQQMSLFNGYYGGYGYQPILVFDEPGSVGGAAGRCLAYKHTPTLAKSKPLWDYKNDIFPSLWNYTENLQFYINKIDTLPTPYRQNRLFIAGICGT